MRKKIILTSDLHYGFSDRTHKILDEFYQDIIIRDKPDYFIIAGDIISHKQSQWDSALKQLRNHFDCPILVVFGNHDLWQMGRQKDTIWSLKKKILTKLKLYDITYLPHNPIIEDDFKIYGFDGWYGKREPPSRDLEYMSSYIEGMWTHDYLKKTIGVDQMKMIPEKGDTQQIVITHFDFNGHPMSGETKWLDTLHEKADVLCVGHSHKHRFETIMDMQIINPGSDYDKPDSVRFWGGWS